MTATAKAAAVRPPAVVPQAPPPDLVSAATQNKAPNWAIKTAMAATGSLLAALLIVYLVADLWFFTFDGRAAAGHVGAFWLVVLVLMVAHMVLGGVLAWRARRGRGQWRAKLHSGTAAWLTWLMPPTGVAVAVLTVFCAGLVPLSPPWAAVAHVAWLIVVAVHAGHGLSTVATIASGSGVLAARLRGVALTISGVVLGALMVANAVVTVIGGWLG